MKKLLAIESTAHTLGVSVASMDGMGKIGILSNELAKYPSKAQGYIPRKLAEFHARNFPKVLSRALAVSGTKLSELDYVAYARGPGIGHCLQVGYQAARTLSIFLGIPLVPVNHAVAHAEVVKYFEHSNDPLIVYVSGGNTQIIYKENDRYRVLGETLDIGIGNFLDLLGRTLALEPPDAVGVLKLAGLPGCDYIGMPYIVKGMSVSYSGMLTYAEKLAREGARKSDLCYSAQETAFAAFCEAAERALLHSGKREILLCGGNARNRRLQEMMGLMAQENGARMCVGKDEYLGDNAAMIALTGLLMAASGSCKKVINPKPVQDLRIDSEEIGWQARKT